MPAARRLLARLAGRLRKRPKELVQRQQRQQLFSVQASPRLFAWVPPLRAVLHQAQKELPQVSVLRPVPMPVPMTVPMPVPMLVPAPEPSPVLVPGRVSAPALAPAPVMAPALAPAPGSEPEPVGPGLPQGMGLALQPSMQLGLPVALGLASPPAAHGAVGRRLQHQ